MNVQALLSDIPEFERRQAAKCRAVGIETRDLAFSHVAIRCRTWGEYIDVRDELEALSVANLENVWNGRPISKLMLESPIEIAGGRAVPLIELIPPFHQRVYPMGLEHVGYVVGASFDAFARRHSSVLTGQRFQSDVCRPVYIRFDDYSHVRFYAESMRDACIREGARFDGFTHSVWRSSESIAGPWETTDR